VVCDADACAHTGRDLTDFAVACVDAGARLLQLRAKHAGGGWMLDAAARIMERTRGAGAYLIVNDRADVARAAGAAGVHVGQDDLHPSDIRRITGPGFAIGFSTHTPQQLAAALRFDVDYVAVGPVFATATKHTGYDAVGIEWIRAAAAQTAAAGRPLVAIGGITLESARAVIDAGASSVAVISDLLGTGAPAARVRQYAAAGVI
jgi:thiamine-phosphate pyrophosphorylase